MSHIHTELGQYDMAAGGFIFRLDTPEPTVLLHRHKKLNSYMHIGGHIELDESPWAALMREIEEESGYMPDQLQVLQPAQHLLNVGEGVMHPTPLYVASFPYGGNADHLHTDLAYALVAKGEPRSVIGEGESTDMRLFTRAELLALPEQDILPSVSRVAVFVFDEVLPNWQRLNASEYQIQAVQPANV